MKKEEISKYFDEICGYEKEKLELTYLADVMTNMKEYEKLGARLPGNLMLAGPPGVGKTLMAKCLIDASGRKSFVCRRTDGDKDFIEVIKDTFRKAAESEPSIVLLDDMDKFAGRFRSESAELAAVQACLDDVKDRDVFVIATINESEGMSESLIRPGRFDHQMAIGTPDEKSAGQIIDRYLMTRGNIADDIDRDVLVQLTNGKTAVEIMTLANEAAVFAGYDRAEAIHMRHVVRAFVDSIGNYKGNIADESAARITACHEAGHAVMSELLDPGSAAIVFAADVMSDSSGFMSRGRRNKTLYSGQFREDALISLAGRAATEIVTGAPDRGSEMDIKTAFMATDREVRGVCAHGLRYVRAYRGRLESEKRRNRCDAAVRKRMMEYYREAMAILQSNRLFLDRMTEELCEHGYLMQKDIARIREEISMAEQGETEEKKYA